MLNLSGLNNSRVLSCALNCRQQQRTRLKKLRKLMFILHPFIQERPALDTKRCSSSSQVKRDIKALEATGPMKNMRSSQKGTQGPSLLSKLNSTLCDQETCLSGEGLPTAFGTGPFPLLDVCKFPVRGQGRSVDCFALAPYIFNPAVPTGCGLPSGSHRAVALLQCAKHVLRCHTSGQRTLHEGKIRPIETHKDCLKTPHKQKHCWRKSQQGMRGIPGIGWPAAALAAGDCSFSGPGPAASESSETPATAHCCNWSKLSWKEVSRCFVKRCMVLLSCFLVNSPTLFNS
ncbi:MAG: hypothetical protein FRX49_05114 [Trebouxia sp. A1-2]|nr:MAG: hypothetical protein FRX49_05114 [Trebouxia sp. A1-2]